MKDIELVIKIPECFYKYCKAQTDATEIQLAVTKGILLPKEHGRLFDMDEFVKNIVKEYGVNSIHELPQDIKIFYDKFINSAPTILDATFDYKLKNYAFFRKKEEK